MTKSRTLPTAKEIIESESKEMTPDAVLAGYLAARTCIIELIDGYLNGDEDRASKLMNRLGAAVKESEDWKIVESWAQNYFLNILHPEAKDIEGTIAALSSREICLLGQLHEFGIAVPLNIDKALEYYSLAAARGEAFGYFLKGENYHFFKRQIEDAKKNFQEAINLGCNLAYNNLAMCIEAKEEKAALDYYHKTASGTGYRNAGICYKLGVLGVQKDHNKAKKLFIASALTGNPGALHSYSNLLPPEETYKFLRLAHYHSPKESDAKSVVLEFIGSPEPAKIYHAAFALKNTATPWQKIQLRTAFFELCETKPNIVEKLAAELNDSFDDRLSLFINDDQKEMLALLCLYAEDHGALFPNDTFKIILKYLDLPTFGIKELTQKETDARVATRNLLLTSSTLFKQAAAQAESGRTSYQKVLSRYFR